MLRFLVVDDVNVSRVYLQRLLVRYGQCDTAENGLLALERFSIALEEGRPYALVCLDLLMPGMDGHEVLARLRAQEAARNVPPERQCRVIVITAVDQSRHVLRAAKLSDAYLLKPVAEEQLLEHLEVFGFIKRSAPTEYDARVVEMLRRVDEDLVAAPTLAMLIERMQASLGRQQQMAARRPTPGGGAEARKTE